MENTNRKPGFYWVRYNEWIIAEWDGYHWTVTHNCANYDDNDWTEIDERALAKPSNEAEATAILPHVSGSLLIDFAVYLTGHDKETIEQMYNDWRQ